MNNNVQNAAKIVLIGFMGTGKSTVSHMLAERLGWNRIDIDDQIVRREDKPIPEIFAEGGEEAFRRIETEVLEAVLTDASGSAVIATGGGAVLRAVNCEAMLQGGFVVALKAEAGQIIARVSSDTNRPLLEGDVETRVKLLLEQRKHAYDFAHYTIDTTSMTAEEVVHAIMDQWSKREA